MRRVLFKTEECIRPDSGHSFYLWTHQCHQVMSRIQWHRESLSGTVRASVAHFEIIDSRPNLVREGTKTIDFA